MFITSLTPEQVSHAKVFVKKFKKVEVKEEDKEEGELEEDEQENK